MLWQGRRQSSNVDDRRKVSPGGIAVGGGLIGVIVLLLNMFLGDGDISQLPELLPSQQMQSPALSPEQQAAEDQRADFVKVVLAETEDVWNNIFQQSGQQYPEPTGIVPQCSAVGMRSCQRCFRTILLSRRSKTIYRPFFL